MTGEGDSAKSRIQILKERVDAATGTKDRQTYSVPFRGKMLPLVKIQVESRFPLYRTLSGRTKVAQAEYIERNKLQRDFFADPEDPRVQRAQHEILRGMIEDHDLKQDLDDKDQRSPIVLTKDGSIVDGNRRTAALREKKEQYIDAVVLPDDATREDIFNTELELQMARETKAPFHWIGELLYLRYGIEELKEDPALIASRMRKDKDEVKRDMFILALVDEYLDWAQTPGAYQKVPEVQGGKSKQAFGDLAQRIQSRKMDGAQRRAIKNACFAAIHQKHGYEAIRSIISAAANSPDKLVEKLGEDKSSSAFVTKARDPPTNGRSQSATLPRSPDPLRQLASESSKLAPKPVQVLGTLFSEPAQSATIVPSLLTAAVEVAEERKESKRKNPLDLVNKATAILESVELTPGTNGIEDIANALSKTDAEVRRLATQVEKLQKG